jgi:hypothetical protein
MNKQTERKELEDMLDYLDPPYETKQQVQIGHMLDKYRIPFFYKQATIVYDQCQNRIEYPAFSLPTYNGTIVDYIADAQSKEYQTAEKLYRYNQIHAVLLTQNDLENRNWQENLYEKLEQIYHQPFSFGLSYNQEPNSR